jgi:cell division transport system permease protein
MREDLWLQVVAVSTLTLCLLIMGLIFLVSFSLDRFLDRISTGAGYRLVLASELSPEQGAALAFELKDWPEVKVSRYVGVQEGLEILRQRLGAQTELLEDLEKNPLPAIIEVELAADGGALAAFKLKAAALAGIVEVVEARPWLERLEQTRYLIRLATMGLGLAMFLALALVVTNTVRLAVYVRREQLVILDMLGASRLYMRGPFILESILQALLAGALSSASLALLLRLIPLFPETPLWLSAMLPLDLPWHIPLYLCAITLLAGLAGSWLGVNRILRLPQVA